METTKIRTVKNGVYEEISLPIFYDIQTIKINHSVKINIPSELVLVKLEYDEIKNDGVCVSIGPENFRYIISDFKHDSVKTIQDFIIFTREKNDEKMKDIIDKLKEKYFIIDNQTFANYLKGTHGNNKSVKLGLELIFDYLGKPSESFNFDEELKKDKHMDKIKDDIGTFISDKSSYYKETDISIIQTNIDLFFELEDIDISEYFNLLKMSTELPFAVYNSFFKILKSFDIPDEWVEIKSDNSLIFYMLNTAYIPQKVKTEYYTRISVTEISSSENINKFKINIVSRLNDGLNETDLIERILKFLPKRPKNCSYAQNEIVAEYFLDIKNDKFYEQIFSDFIMTGSELVSNILISDESDIIMRQKGGLFAYFRSSRFSDFEDFIGININNIKVKPYEHKLFPNILKIDDNALHIKIKGIPNLQKAKGVQKILDIIISYYLKNNQAEIVNKYKEFMDNIQQILDFQKPEEAVEGKEFLKYQAPDIFTGKYASKCSGREPVLISEKEAQKSEGDIIKFPFFGEGEPRYFRCDHNSDPYVGLLPNDSLDAKYPYYPCCFGTDQKNDPKSLRYKYEKNISEEEKQPKSKKSKRLEIFTSPQVMEDNVVAILNPKIKNTLEILNTSNYPKIKSVNPSYLRLGTVKSPDSVLDAIIKSISNYNKINKESVNRSLLKFGIPLNYTDLNSEEKIKILKETREHLVKFIITNITSQSTYSYELDALVSYLKDQRNYLDIKMFWNILEHAFEIKLFLFQKPVDDNGTSLITPIYTQNYLKKTNNNYLVIVLIEHFGVKNINLQYPQVENIVFNEFTEDLEYNPRLWLSQKYDNDKGFIDNLTELMNDLLNYNGSVNRPIDINFKNTVLSQWADSYGKIRLLQFRDVCVLCDPIPPLESPQINSIMRCDYKPCKYEDAIQFLKSENIQNYKYNIIGGIIIGIIWSKPSKYACKQLINDINGIRLYIPIVPFERKNSISSEQINKTEIISPSFIGKTSIIDSYNKFIKISKYLKEYTLWTFSKWVNDNNISKLDEQLLYKFAERGFSIIPEVEYPQRIGREFKTDVDNMIYGGKIIVQNIQVRNRLMYNLNLELLRDSKNVINYYNRKIIKNFFIDVNDFIQDSNYIVIYGLYMLKAYMVSNIPPNHVINSRIVPGKDLYFLQLNNNLRVKYLAQPAKSIEHALYICSVWAVDKFNPGYFSTGELPNVKHTLYTYNDFSDYSDFTDPEEIEVPGRETPDEYSVLTYKQNNELYFVSLLPFIEC